MSVEQLVKALDGLQTDAARRQEYNQWLQDFRKGAGAWQVSYEVLAGEEYPRGLKIFCAQTLRDKIARDLHQVPRESRLELKDQVLILLERNKALLSVVGAQLCIALAAFAMQVAEWETPVQELISRFDKPEEAPVLFEFLKTLPEEFNSNRAGMVDPGLRLQRSELIVQNTAPDVLNFMLSRAEVMAATGDSQCLFFQTLRPWLNEVDLEHIVQSPLVDWMIASVDSEEARAAAVDCLLNVLAETSEVMEPKVQMAISVLFPKLLALAERQKSEYSSNPELLRDMSRLLSYAGEMWHTLLCRQPDVFMPLLNAVVDCINGLEEPSVSEVDIALYPYEFFERVRFTVGDPLPGSSRPITQGLDKTPFIPIFTKVFDRYVELLQFPRSGELTGDDEENFRELRYDIGDVLKLCSSIMGAGRALEQCFTHLEHFAKISSEKGPEQTPWQPIEALLFATRAVARTVPFEENQWMPRIYSLYEHLPRSDNNLVQHAALMVLGRYSAWIGAHQEYLKFVLRYILQAAWAPHVEVRRAAAHAFLFLCTDVSRELTPYLPEITEVYNSLTGQYEIESLCKFADGVGSVINCLPFPEMSEALRFVFGPVAVRANALKEDIEGTSPGNGGAMPTLAFQQQVANDIQALGSLIAMMTPPECDFQTCYNHPLVVQVKSLHPLFLKLIMATSPATAENPQRVASDVLLNGVVRYYIRMMFVLSANVCEELPSLMSAAVKIIGFEPHTPVLYELSSAINQCFNSAVFAYPQNVLDEVQAYSVEMCKAFFSSKTTDLLKVQGEIVDHITLLSSVIHHGFHMLCDIAIYYPEKFFTELLVPSVLLSVQVFDYCWDTDALNAVSHLFDDFESFLSGVGGEPPDPKYDPKYESMIISVFEQLGYDLVLSLFNWFLLKPDFQFEMVVEHLVDLLFRMAPRASVTWVQKLLATLPEGTLSDEEKIVFSQKIFQLMGSQNFSNIGLEMNNFVKAYSARNLQPR